MACSKEAVLELKDVVLAVKEVTRWYEVGLQLGLPEEKLKLISSHPDIEGHQRMMLSKWLSYDPEASWAKLVAALRAIGERSVAEKVARQLLSMIVVRIGAEGRTQRHVREDMLHIPYPGLLIRPH